MKQEEIIKIIGRECLDSINSRLKLLKLVNIEFGNEGDEDQLPEKRKLILSYDINGENVRASEYNKFYEDVQKSIVEISLEHKSDIEMGIEYPYLDNYIEYMPVEPDEVNPVKVSPEVFDLFTHLVEELNHDVKMLNSESIRKIIKSIFEKICKDFYGVVKIVK